MSEEEQRRGEREPGAIPEQSEATPEPERAPESRGEAASGTESATGSESESAASESKAEPKAEPETEDERRERWRLAREADDRRRRRTRIAAWCGVGVLLLGGAGWIAEPFVQDRLITSDACDGALPDGTMDTLRAGAGEAYLTESEAESDDDLGRYTCKVVNEEGTRVLSVHAWTRRDDIDRRLIREVTGRSGVPGEALSGGLPGFRTSVGVALLPECPGRGKDAAGQQRQLLVEVRGALQVKWYQLARAGAAVANKASEKLGCDTDPLPLPAKGSEKHEPEAVSAARAADTACAALAQGPFRSGDWSFDLRIPKRSGPVTTCLVRPSGRDGNGRAHAPVVRLYGVYGQWSQEMMLEAANRSGAPTAGTVPRKWLTDERAGATARCGGRPAGFLLGVDRPDGESDEPQAVSTERLSRERMRAILASFAKKESARRDCTELRLPAAD
ncbi:hypothetical protein AB0939_15580 [Streptomyces sp. NPDC006990]|uniref:hypothetical protein n=1 Tax=Streptomyces sp. NPDC006990 TaxID=3154481 RepID=UPI003451D71E